MLRLVSVITGVSPAHLISSGMGIVTSLSPYLMRALRSHRSPSGSFIALVMVYSSAFGSRSSRPVTVKRPMSFTLVRSSSSFLINSSREGGAGSFLGESSANDHGENEASTTTMAGSPNRIVDLRVRPNYQSNQYIDTGHALRFTVTRPQTRPTLSQLGAE